MNSNTPDIATYLAEVPLERRAAIEKLRSLCLQILDGYDECLAYNMPAYKRNGVLEVAFANQKQYISLYILKKEVLDEFRDALSAVSIGKGCIRFTRPEKIDFAVIQQLLRRNMDSATSPC